MAGAVALSLLWWGAAKVPTDTNLALHWTPGAWFILLSVHCDREAGMEAEIMEPSGKVLCPLSAGNAATAVANKCDCVAYSLGARQNDADGWALVDISSWKPKRGL